MAVWPTCAPPPKFPAYSSGVQYFSTCIRHTVIPVGVSVWMTSTWILGLHISPIKEQEKNKNKPDETYKLTIHYKKMVGGAFWWFYLLLGWTPACTPFSTHHIKCQTTRWWHRHLFARIISAIHIFISYIYVYTVDIVLTCLKENAQKFSTFLINTIQIHSAQLNA